MGHWIRWHTDRPTWIRAHVFATRRTETGCAADMAVYLAKVS